MHARDDTAAHVAQGQRLGPAVRGTRLLDHFTRLDKLAEHPADAGLVENQDVHELTRRDATASVDLVSAWTAEGGSLMPASKSRMKPSSRTSWREAPRTSSMEAAEASMEQGHV